MSHPRKVIGSLLCAAFTVALSVPCWSAEDTASASAPASERVAPDKDKDASKSSKFLQSLAVNLFDSLAAAKDERRASPFEPPGKPPDRPPVPPGKGGEPPGKPPDRPPDHAQNDKDKDKS